MAVTANDVVQRAQLLPLRAVVAAAAAVCPRGQKWPPMAHATLSSVRLNFFLSLAADVDVVVVGTDVVSCLLLSINAGRRFFLLLLCYYCWWLWRWLFLDLPNFLPGGSQE